MAMKLVSILLTILVVVSANEKLKRQSGIPDMNQFNEYFGQFQEHLKPIAGQFPSMPNGFGSLPNFPGFEGFPGGSGGSSSNQESGNSKSSGPSYQWK